MYITYIFEFDVNLNRINLGVDSILRLVKIIQSKIPKKVKRGLTEHVNPRFGQLPNNKSRGFTMANLLDSSIARKIRMSRRKKTLIEFLGSASFKLDLIDVKYEFSGLDNKFHDLPLNSKFLIDGLSISLKQNHDHPINYHCHTSMLFSEELPKPVELIMMKKRKKNF